VTERGDLRLCHSQHLGRIGPHFTIILVRGMLRQPPPGT
jgi:hypothetical protein